MKQKIKWVWLVFVVLAMAGCVTTPKQMMADKLVDELCAKDGGIKVYETVTLPKNRFNEQGYFDIPLKGHDKPTDEYYMVYESKQISGIDPTVHQSQYRIYRRSNQKVLGIWIGYWRRGGDIPLPAHPSSYDCPNTTVSDLIKNIFLKAN